MRWRDFVSGRLFTYGFSGKVQNRVIFVKILGIDEIVSALLGEPLVLGEGQAIESPEEEFEGEQQDIKDDRYGNSNLKHGKALLRVRVCRRGYAWRSIISAHFSCARKRRARRWALAA